MSTLDRISMFVGGTTPAPRASGVRARRRGVAAAALVLLMAASATGAASAAATTLADAEHRLHSIEHRIEVRRALALRLRRDRARLADRAAGLRRSHAPEPWARARGRGPSRSSSVRERRHVRHRLGHLARERAGLGRRAARATNQARRLGRAASRVDAEIWRIRPIGLCPVRGPHTVSDDFGAPRWVDHKMHIHMGNDILAPYGTPIVAPFDGRAVSAPNSLGGMAVKVYGASGYAYNAHLSRYGRLGPVSAGTVVGYVGNSGDARGGAAHDHFEWHPGDGPAVDPHALLMMVC